MEERNASKTFAAGLLAIHSFSNCFFAASMAFSFSAETSGYFRPSEWMVSAKMFATSARLTHLWLEGMTYHGAHSVLVASMHCSKASIYSSQWARSVMSEG